MKKFVHLAAMGSRLGSIAKTALPLALLLAARPVVAGDSPAAKAPDWGTKSLIIQRAHAYAFAPSFSTQGVGVFQNGRYATTGAGAKEFIAPLELPSGALVESIALLACEDGTGTVTGSLDEIALGDLATVNPLLSIATQSGQGCQDPGVIALSPFTIDNHFHLYQLRIVINGPAGSGLRFYDISVGYHLQISPAPASPTFGDVPVTHTYFRAIEALAASGITGGCGNGNYCPNQFVTRGEMAVFFARALGLFFEF
jgi:hypothetical protein